MSEKVFQHQGSNSFLASLAIVIVVLCVAAVTLGCGGGLPAQQAAGSPPSFQGGTNQSPTGIIGANPPVPQGVLNPASIGFGDVPVGSSISQAAQLTNTGNADLQVTQIVISGSTSMTLSGITFPLVVTPGQSVPFSIQFAPAAVGPVSATLTVSSNSTNPIPALALSGNGVTSVGAQLSANPSAFTFGAVIVGNSATQAVTLRSTGGQPVVVSAITGPAGFTITNLPGLPLTLAPGQSQVLNVQFAPASAGLVTGVLSLSSDASNSPTTVALAGLGVTATLTLSTNPTSIDFGTIIVASSATQNVLMTNTGNTAVTVTAANVTGAGYAITPALAFPLTLGPGQSQAFSLRFQPAAAGVVAGSVSLVSNATASPATIALTGAGLAQVLQLVLNPASIGFGDVQTGQTDSRLVTATNTGNSSVTITAANVTGAGFSQTGLAIPLTLTPGQSTNFSAVFAPAAAGPASGSISLVSTATNSPVAVTLTGNGVAASVLALTANPGSLNFGDVFVGAADTRTITLTNTGTVNVTVNTANSTGAGFSVVGFTSQTLTPGQAMPFTARFAPAVTGAATGAIIVTSTAANSPNTVSLTGNGVTQLSVSPANINFGSVSTGSAQSQTVTVTNTGNANVTVTAATATGAPFTAIGFTAQTLAPGQSLSFQARFAPTSAGVANGSVSVVSTATNSPANVSLTGTGVAATLTISASPTSVNFGNVAVGGSGSQSVTLTNTGNGNVTVNSATPAGAGFSVTGFTAGTLTPGQSTNFMVQFTPGANGPATGSVSVASTATASPTSITLSGNGQTAAPGITVNPSSINFGPVVVGSSFAQNILVTNTGNQSLTISSASVTGTGFSITGLTTPLTINPGQSSNFNVVFAPSATGPVSGSVSLNHNAAGSPSTVALSGTGATGLGLAWDASAASVAGYRVYRSTAPGSGFTLLNTSLITGLTYVDSTVVPGTTYFYVATALDVDGVESIFSNQVTVIIP